MMTAAGRPISITIRDDTSGSSPKAQITTLWHARAHVGQTFSRAHFNLVEIGKLRLIRFDRQAKLGQVAIVADDPDQGHGDPPAETDVDVGPRPARRDW